MQRTPIPRKPHRTKQRTLRNRAWFSSAQRVLFHSKNFVYSTQGALSNQNPNSTALAIDALQSLMSEVIKFRALEDLENVNRRHITDAASS